MVSGIVCYNRGMTKLCSFPECHRPFEGNGLCTGHNRQLRQGKELSPLRQYIKNDGSVPEGQKLCRSCHIVKSLDDFEGKRHDNKAIHCKNCNRLKYKMRKFGLSLEELIELLRSQDNRCAICEIPLEKKFSIDHDHNTGKVRGALCGLCNSGIGLLRDDPYICQRASTYLRKHIE